MLRIFACLTLAVALAGCASQQPLQSAAPPPALDEHGVTEWTLKNGMRVIVRQDTRAPLAVVQVWYRVGGSDEPQGLTGISHALEHMMFKDSARYTGAERTELLKREGARHNAFTSADYTAYYAILRNERMALAFDIEADRMVNLKFQQSDFDKEIQVVKEERRLRVDDRPVSKLYEEFYANAFSDSPSRNPIVGWMSDLKAMTLGDLRDWYQQWYAPNNAILVVVGDVEVAEVARLASRYFEDIPARELPSRKPRAQTPPPHIARDLTLSLPAKEPHLAVGYHTPALNNAAEEWHPHALWLLSHVLSGDEYSRLPSTLVREREIARSADVGYYPFARYDGLFVFSVTPQHGTDIATMRQALLAEIEKVKTTPISDRELQLALTRARASMIYGLDSINHQAMRIGRLETMGYSWKSTDDFLERAKQITPEQVRAVAREYLTAGRRTIAVLNPLSADTSEQAAAKQATRASQKQATHR